MKLTACLIFAALSVLSIAADAPRANVVVMFADDQRADTIAALGNAHIQTPNLDRLVKRGVSFDRAYMQGGFNGATCVPSRAMLLSGRSLFHIDEKLLQHRTWPEAFAGAGYTTFVSGKWHNGNQSLERVFQIAKSMFTGGMTNPMEAQLRQVTKGKLQPPVKSTKHACEVFADETVAFLKKQPAEHPFLAYVPFDAPHDPHIVPDDFPIRYQAADIPLPENFLPQHPWDNGEMKVRDEKLLPTPRDPQQIREMLADYYRYISYLDLQVGRILDAVDASPFAKNTYIVYAADSGVARGSHGLIGKQNLYEHSLRVPLIVAGPGIPAGQRTQALCYTYDVLPTLGKLTNVPGPETSQGHEFTHVLQDPTKSARSELCFAYQQVQRAYADTQWKLISYPKTEQWQMFDLLADPQEKTNLATSPEHHERLNSLQEKLAKSLAEAGDKAH
jgi:arylsulfatase A-like enzyme